MSKLRNYLKGGASTETAPGTVNTWSTESAGPFIGVVKNNIDSTKMGRIQVNIPSLTKTNNPNVSQLITCEYLSPFYGAKPVKYNIPNSDLYEASQHSYGFWGVPPDLETQVLVIGIQLAKLRLRKVSGQIKPLIRVKSLCGLEPSKRNS